MCGSREWTDERIVRAVLNGFHWECGEVDMVLIEGGARGADAIAGAWADEPSDDIVSPDHRCFPADWEKHGKAAGPIRNQRMLDEGKPDVVLAFKDEFQRDPTITVRTEDGTPKEMTVKGRQAKGGTEDMVRRAKAAGIPVYIVSHG